jgi:hypothetical protein
MPIWQGFSKQVPWRYAAAAGLSWRTFLNPLVDAMKPFSHCLLSAGLALAFAGCAPVSQLQDYSARLDEGNLRDAGFKLLLADTMDRQNALETLPSYSISRIEKNGNFYYIYPDPDGCVCLFVGRDEEYQRLQQLGVDRQISDQQLMANDIAADSRNGFGPYSTWNSWINNNPGRPDWDPH